MLTTNDAVSAAFQLLVTTVRERYQLGRSRVGATLKLELRRRSYNSFDEIRLGFPKFGDFLRAAQRAGQIQITPTPGGDIEVWPADVDLSKVASGSANLFSSVPTPRDSAPDRWSPPAMRAPVRVRQDLWSAFNSFSENWVYDKAADRAYRRTPNIGQNDGVFADPNVLEVPGGRDRVVSWMKSFAEKQSPLAKSQLMLALQGPGATFQFGNLVRTNPPLRREWGRYHVDQVLAAINSWATTNGVRPQNVTGPFTYRSVSPSMSAPADPVSFREPISITPQVPLQTSGLPVLTPRLAALIDELVDELLRLRGILQMIESKR